MPKESENDITNWTIYIKKRIGLAGILVGETRIPPWQDEMKNVPASYKRNARNIIETYACWDPKQHPVFRLSYKQP